MIGQEGDLAINPPGVWVASEDEGLDLIRDHPATRVSPLPELLFQSIEGQVIVEAMWTANPSPSLLWGIRCGGSGATATPASTQGQAYLGRTVRRRIRWGDRIDLFANFLADPAG
jgi:hypothetical protein